MSVLANLELSLVHPAGPHQFTPAEMDGLPDAVKRYFEASIAPDTPLYVSARLRMKGQIKVKRWLPFRARQVLNPHLGFVWAGRAGGVIVGGDSYAEGRGLLDWKIAGLLTVAHAEGPDVSRSAAGRGGAEAIWLPTALLPRFGVEWSADSSDAIRAAHLVDNVPVELNLQLDGEGRVRSMVFDRWGDPGNAGTFGAHPFGGEVTAYATFAGLTIPSAGRFGWFFGTDRWEEGEFFRYEITDLRPVGRS